MQFVEFKAAIAKQYAAMQNTGVLLRASTERDPIWEAYIKSFPEGSNPIHIKNTVHDCSCCRSFIRTAGNAVAIVDGKLTTIWDVAVNDSAYQTVADALHKYVLSQPITDEFLHYEAKIGTDKNREILAGGDVTTYEHFHVTLKPAFVATKSTIPTKLNKSRTAFQVFMRALTEITPEAIDTVLELIAQNSLYRGEEHKAAVAKFRDLQKMFKSITGTLEPKLVEAIIWTSTKDKVNAAAVYIRNSVIGSLLVDLSTGVDLEQAVKSFELKVAPTNYKRPTSLITKAMIEKAQAKINELGLSSALGRRYAKLDDITVNNILFANREAKRVMAGDVFDMLAAKAPEKSKALDHIEEVTIDKFVNDILPNITSLEVLLENHHNSNLVSLIAPEDPTSGLLFKWPNNFSWSYTGDVADSIKERVKAAGGAVEGYLCCRLAWDYKDDLDFHMYEPDRFHIYFGTRRALSTCGGMLDLDANGADGQRDDPAENIYYKTNSRMKEGAYSLEVHNYNRRSDGRGFEVEIETGDATYNYVHEKIVKNNETVKIAKFNYTRDKGVELLTQLSASKAVKTFWQLPTQVFHPVDVMMMSPNCWDDNVVGNKHYFFMLHGCTNPEKARGFYNEFLNSKLDEHRKVFEIVGSNMKTENAEGQLSGLGFSSTQRASLVVRVKGSFTRDLRINF